MEQFDDILQEANGPPSATSIFCCRFTATLAVLFQSTLEVVGRAYVQLFVTLTREDVDVPHEDGLPSGAFGVGCTT